MDFIQVPIICDNHYDFIFYEKHHQKKYHIDIKYHMTPNNVSVVRCGVIWYTLGQG